MYMYEKMIEISHLHYRLFEDLNILREREERETYSQTLLVVE